MKTNREPDMETGNSGSLTVTVALQEQKRTFLTDELQLKRLSRDLSKASKDAVDVLIEMLKSQDVKIKMQAAVKLLEFDIDVKKTLASDQMQRMIAEIKLNNAGGNKTLELEEDRKSRPVVDFTTIQSI
jgi:hypothetical protein